MAPWPTPIVSDAARRGSQQRQPTPDVVLTAGHFDFSVWRLFVTEKTPATPLA